MVRHALRRLLWSLPALVGISLLTFLFLSYVPEPTDDPAVAAVMTRDELTNLRRERFLDLPRFVNTEPRDVRVRADAALLAASEGQGPAALEGQRELVRLGGAALPYVIPRLDTLAPEPRARVALALAPIARRMGLRGAEETADPARALAFWTRFWADRGIEFRRPAVRSAVSRLVRYGTDSREADLFELDTFALDDVLGALETPTDNAGVVRARSLIAIAAHATERTDVIAANDSVESARACVERWRAYWRVYRSDFTVFQGASRVAAMVLETRYGKWAFDAVANRFGRLSSGGSVQDELFLRAPLTLTLLFGGLALAYAIAIPLGALSAAYRKQRLDLAIGSAVIALYCVPTAGLAVLAVVTFGVQSEHLIVPIFVLALSHVAAPTRQQRSALATALSQDYVRAARARGAGRVRAVLVHALRNSLMPVVTLATLEAPMSLSRVFVVEAIFHIPGLGDATIRAVQQKDAAWLMAFSLWAASIAAVFVLATDVTYALLDPRLESGVPRGRA